MNGLETGGVIVLALGLVEIIKMLINRRKNNIPMQVTPTVETGGLTDKQKHQLQTLYDLHYRFDDNGAPLWYIPRSWGDTQKDIAKLLETVVHIQDTIMETQRTQTEVLRIISEKLSKIKE